MAEQNPSKQKNLLVDILAGKGESNKQYVVRPHPLYPGFTIALLDTSTGIAENCLPQANYGTTFLAQEDCDRMNVLLRLDEAFLKFPAMAEALSGDMVSLQADRDAMTELSKPHPLTDLPLTKISYTDLRLGDIVYDATWQRYGMIFELKSSQPLDEFINCNDNGSFVGPGPGTNQYFTREGRVFWHIPDDGMGERARILIESFTCATPYIWKNRPRFDIEEQQAQAAEDGLEFLCGERTIYDIGMFDRVYDPILNQYRRVTMLSLDPHTNPERTVIKWGKLPGRYFWRFELATEFEGHAVKLSVNETAARDGHVLSAEKFMEMEWISGPTKANVYPEPAKYIFGKSIGVPASRAALLERVKGGKDFPTVKEVGRENLRLGDRVRCIATGTIGLVLDISLDDETPRLTRVMSINADGGREFGGIADDNWEWLGKSGKTFQWTRPIAPPPELSFPYRRNTLAPYTGYVPLYAVAMEEIYVGQPAKHHNRDGFVVAVTMEQTPLMDESRWVVEIALGDGLIGHYRRSEMYEVQLKKVDDGTSSKA